MTNCFVFDINKCVGCHACIIACTIENNTNLPVNWRQVYEFNAFKHPDLPVFYHSLACNHCEDPLCLKSCPANAYYRDKETNAIIHEPDKCFGCKYCTWACPYDAPKYNEQTKLIEKCSFCNDRIKEGLKPACANLCPTGALDFQFLDKTKQNKTQGFPDKNIQPNIVFIAQNDQRKELNIAVPQSDQSAKQFIIDSCNKQPKKIQLKNEWVLVFFTLIVAVLTGWFAASIFNSTIIINPLLFLFTGGIAMILSAVHLGKKWRAYRAIFNLKSSWLSREIFFFGSFILVGSIVLFHLLNLPYLNYFALFLALATVISVDMVYKYTEKRTFFGLHSANITFTALLLFGFLSKFIWIAGIIIVVKLLLHFSTKKITITKNSYGNLLFSLIRVIIGLLLPVYLYFNNVQDIIIILFILTGEVFDRIEFYFDMDVITPQKQLIKQLISEL